MPKGKNQKMKLYYLAKIMLQRTDDEHGLGIMQIKKLLEEYGVTADRKSLYDDMDALREMGIDIICERSGKDYFYHVGSKHFDIAELKLLVDAIQSSKFITAKKSDDLIKKLTSMASRYEAEQLNRQVTVRGRVKNMNESIYYSVDDVHRAIAENRKIKFEYMTWTPDKELVKRREEPYVVSPWALTWDDENYYLIAYDEDADRIKHFRVDKIKKVRVLDELRAGKSKFKEFDLAKYAKMNFGMFGGETVNVKIAFANEMVGVFIDRFGRDISIRPSKTKGWSETNVDVCMSSQFLGWIFALGPNVKILGPKAVVKEFKAELEDRMRIYGKC